MADSEVKCVYTTNYYNKHFQISSTFWDLTPVKLGIVVVYQNFNNLHQLQ